MPRVGLLAQHAASLTGERIELRAPVGLGPSPFRSQQAALLEAVQCGVERAILDDERVVGLLVDPASHAVAMIGAVAQRLQHEDIEGALQKAEQHASLTPERFRGVYAE